MKEEYLDTPTEITDSSRAQQMLNRAQKEKEEYEETYLTRLPVTKAEKHRQRKLTTLGNCSFLFLMKFFGIDLVVFMFVVFFLEENI